MNANELQVGSWVLRNGKPTQVLSILNNESCSVTHGNGWCGEAISQLEPIPITKELLLRSGFELKSESPYSQYFAIDFDDVDIDYLVVELHPKANYVRVNYQTEKRKVQLSCSLGGCHLHELQHLLTLCKIDFEFSVKTKIVWKR